MIVAIWNFIRGFVTVEVTGRATERFINMAVHRDIYIWDAQSSPDGVFMNVSLKGYKELKACAKKTGCQYRIIAKKGFPFVARRYGKRKLLPIGALFFMFSVYILSTFVWAVEISGCERLAGFEISEFCAANGLRPGAFKSRIDEDGVEKLIMKRFADIAWVNVYIRGTRATVEIKETLPLKIIVDKTTPCDVVAAKDGVIINVAASLGSPVVKTDDVVRKGDALVSGKLEIKRDDAVIRTDYIHAEANVLAKVYYRINFSVPFKYSEKQFTGNIYKHTGFILFDRKFSLEKTPPFKCFEQSSEHKRFSLGEDYPLPFIAIVTTYKEFVPIEKTRGLDEALKLADKIVTGRIIREFDIESDIIEKKINFVENPDGILIKSIITATEDIGREKPLWKTRDGAGGPAEDPAGDPADEDENGQTND
ncbi:MAG: sporulation protein YqfD [Clostridiales bacterium]|jgi:similar to stage IV sporulation protein|nr:sporulation protein YqfD [Clostridiales bacterium]